MANVLTKNPLYFDTGNNTTPQIAAGRSIYPVAITIRNKSMTGAVTFVLHDAAGSVILETYLVSKASQTFPMAGCGPLKNGILAKRRATNFGVGTTVTMTIFMR